jgi:hypothetical protein
MSRPAVSPNIPPKEAAVRPTRGSAVGPSPIMYGAGNSLSGLRPMGRRRRRMVFLRSHYVAHFERVVAIQLFYSIPIKIGTRKTLC